MRSSFFSASEGGVLAQKTESCGESPSDSIVETECRDFPVGVLNGLPLDSGRGGVVVGIFRF